MKKIKGFTLIELLIVVAIIGIIAAIAIPNMLDALQRSRQKKSIGEVKTIGTAIQSFTTGYNGKAPTSDFDGNIDPVNNTSICSFTDADTSNVFVPNLIQAWPKADGWGAFYQYRGSPATADGVIYEELGNKALGRHFVVGSFAADGAASVGLGQLDQKCSDLEALAAWFCVDGPIDYATNPNVDNNTISHCYETDIVWGDSQFLQVPDGTQKGCGV
jgi:prepilin-type N-terminal cleavage/methylation domain-containing protein